MYRLLLRVWPAEFRERFGPSAVRDFEALHADAVEEGHAAVIRLWLRTIWTVVAGGIAERRSGRAERSGRGSWLADVVRDARLAMRSMRRSPGFAATTVLLVGLGVGATTTIFSAVDTVLLRPLPYPESERLVTVRKASSLVPIPDYAAIRDRTHAFEILGAAWGISVDLTGGGAPERAPAALVSAGFFDLLGVTAARGRLFSPEEYGPGVADVAVISSSLWFRRWGGDPDIVGRTITLQGSPVTVIGVLDAGFIAPEALGLAGMDVFQPLDLTRQAWQNPYWYVLDVIARLHPGTSVENARAELNALVQNLAREGVPGWQDDGAPTEFAVTPLASATIGEAGQALWLFFGAVLLMLLITCANVANLYLARATGRTHELSVRTALGAGRTRIVRELVTESVSLALLGGLLGSGLAFGGVRLFASMDAIGIPRLAELRVDVRVLAFAFGLSVFTGILFGLAPSVAVMRSDASGALRINERGVTAGKHRSFLRSALVVAQLTLALVLVTGATVLMRSFLHLRGADTGLDPDNVLTLQLDTDARVLPEDRLRYVDDLLGRIGAIHGVTAVGASWRLPFNRGRCCWSTHVYAPAAGTDTLRPYLHPVTADYFRALGVPIVEGRALAFEDRNAAKIPAAATLQPVRPGQVPVVISRMVADRLWPDRSAIGRVVAMDDMEVIELTVVGVIDGIRHWALDREPAADIYVPFASVAEWHLGRLDIAIRYQASADLITGALRSIMQSVDPEQPIERITSMESRIASSAATPRTQTALLATFALFAFLLAAAGLYGSMLYIVGMRRRELGIRMALGARHGDVVRHIVQHGARLIALGTLLGLATALSAIRLLQNYVFEVSPADPLSILLAIAALSTIGLLACWLPARRAARTDPLVTLRHG